MPPLIKRWMSVLIGLLVALTAVECLRAVGPSSFMPAAALRVGRILPAVLAAAAAGICIALGGWLRRSLASIQGALRAAAGSEPSAAACIEDLRLCPAFAEHLAAIGSRAATLARQRDEQKLAARLAQRRTRHLEAVVQALPAAAIVTDAMDRVVRVNEAAARMLGLPDGTSGPAREPAEIPDPGLRDLLRGGHALAACKQVEHVFQDQAGQKVLAVTIAPFAEGPQDEARGAVALIQDVTRERTAARMKTEFVANASHELRTPLGGIKAYLEMLMDDEARDEQTRDRFYKVMQDEVDRLSNLVDNILNISRIEAGIVKVSKSDVPLTAIVQEVVEAMRPQAAATGIDLTDELLPVFFHVHADREMLRRAVLNLVSNALKYTPQGGRVAVGMRVEEAANEVAVDITDTGIGIAEQDLARLFQKFFRVESGRKVAKGTGLGLVLVKEIVEGLHGGRVSVRSAPGKGSTFTVTLPLVRQKQPAGQE